MSIIRIKYVYCIYAAHKVGQLPGERKRKGELYDVKAFILYKLLTEKMYFFPIIVQYVPCHQCWISLYVPLENVLHDLVVL